MLAKTVNRILSKQGGRRCFSVAPSPSPSINRALQGTKHAFPSSFMLTKAVTYTRHSPIQNICPLMSQRREFSSQGGGMGSMPWMNQNQEPGEALSQYSVDLTQMAKDGKLDPVIGRHEEIRRTLQILARRTKNNPVLIGEPGMYYMNEMNNLSSLQEHMFHCLFSTYITLLFIPSLPLFHCKELEKQQLQKGLLKGNLIYFFIKMNKLRFAH